MSYYKDRRESAVLIKIVRSRARARTRLTRGHYERRRRASDLTGANERKLRYKFALSRGPADDWRRGQKYR